MASDRKRVYIPSPIPAQFDPDWWRRELERIAQELATLRNEVKALQDAAPPVV